MNLFYLSIVSSPNHDSSFLFWGSFILLNIFFCSISFHLQGHQLCICNMFLSSSPSISYHSTFISYHYSFWLYVVDSSLLFRENPPQISHVSYCLDINSQCAQIYLHSRTIKIENIPLPGDIPREDFLTFPDNKDNVSFSEDEDGQYNNIAFSPHINYVNFQSCRNIGRIVQ